MVLSRAADVAAEAGSVVKRRGVPGRHALAGSGGGLACEEHLDGAGSPDLRCVALLAALPTSAKVLVIIRRYAP